MRAARMRPLAVALVLAVGLVAPPAAGGTREDPELVDDCGELTEMSLGYHDICAAWFTALTGEEGPPALRVTVAFAEPLEERTPSFYTAWWDVEGCRYSVRVNVDEPRTQAADRSFRQNCGDDTTAVGLPPETVVVDGDELRVTLVFAGGLAPFAADFAEGRTLRRLGASAGPAASGIPAGLGWCIGGSCGDVLADSATGGRDFVMPPGEGPAVTGPLVPGCFDGPASQASADRSHVVDPADDQLRHASASAALDLRLAWLGRDPDGGFSIHIQPGAPASPGEGGYQMEYDGGRYVRAMHRSSGVWRFTFGQRETAEVAGVRYGSRYITLGATTGTADPGSGLVSIRLPAATVGDPGSVFPLERVSALQMYVDGGEQELDTYGHVDEVNNAAVCEATLD